MTRIAFVDTETTGLKLYPVSEPWDFAAVIIDDDGKRVDHQFFIEHDVTRAASQLPPSFLADHDVRYDKSRALVLTRADAAESIRAILHGAHVVGMCPSFDMERHLVHLLAAEGLEPSWHHHLHDIEDQIVGLLRAEGLAGDRNPDVVEGLLTLPYDSEALSRAVGVEPPGAGERHTALGDARWCAELWAAVHAGEGPSGRVPSYERLGRVAFERHGDPDVRGWGLLDVSERELWMGVAAAVVDELADNN